MWLFWSFGISVTWLLQDVQKSIAVTGEKLSNKAKERFNDSSLGLYVIDKNGILNQEREPVERYDLLNKREIFRSLRKPEYTAILNQHYDKLPLFKDSPETHYNDLCKLFETLDIQTIIKHVDEAMSQRFYRVKDLIKIPKELRSIYYFATLTRIERVRVLNFLEKWFTSYYWIMFFVLYFQIRWKGTLKLSCSRRYDQESSDRATLFF